MRRPIVGKRGWIGYDLSWPVVTLPERTNELCQIWSHCGNFNTVTAVLSYSRLALIYRTQWLLFDYSPSRKF